MESRDLISEFKDLLKDAFQETNSALSDSKIGIQVSGTTCTALVTLGKLIFTANVGDSSAMIFHTRPHAHRAVQWKQLTQEHKPHN